MILAETCVQRSTSSRNVQDKADQKSYEPRVPVAVTFSVTGDIAVNTAYRGRLFVCSPCVRLLEGASVNGQPQQHEDDSLVNLVEALQGISVDTPLAKLNETTISDNNGGRIEL